GNSDNGNSDHGNSDHGNSDHGNSDLGNSDHGNGDNSGGTNDDLGAEDGDHERPWVIPPGHYVEVDFVFNPRQNDIIQETLVLLTNDEDPADKEIPVVFIGTGFGAEVVQGTFLDITEVFVRPGDSQPNLDIRLINTGQSHVAGLQFDLDLSDVEHSQLGDTAEEILNNAFTPNGFEVFGHLVAENTLRVVVFTLDTLTIPPSTSPVILASLRYTAGQEVGVEDPIDFVQGSLKVSDLDGNLLMFSSENGAIQIGIPGDVNRDKAIDIRDVVVLVAEIVGRQGFELPGDERGVAFKIRNASDEENENGDQQLDVADAIAIINKILGIFQGPVAKPVSGPVALSLSPAVTLADGRTAIPLTLDGPAVGLEATISFDPARVKVETPVAGEGGGNWLMDSRIENGQLRIVVVSLSAQGLGTPGQPVVYIPALAIGEETGSLDLVRVVLVDRSARRHDTVAGVTTQTVGKGLATPKAFALVGARPNPFNPATEIRYQVPQQTHISLIVYNLLGQEVVRLVDKVQSAGWYSVTWNARNGAGQPVSSGVYMYRLISGTGYTESKRMTLLK
ncbi:MAG: T9SS type A sorting domain-containing protein, partial [candidate division Zixibacteria bacterium]|nr:T9SS type A sorting domain-containing protein [candidate division Zixibacteria bacterium]